MMLHRCKWSSCPRRTASVKTDERRMSELYCFIWWKLHILRRWRHVCHRDADDHTVECVVWRLVLWRANGTELEQCPTNLRLYFCWLLRLGLAFDEDVAGTFQSGAYSDDPDWLVSTSIDDDVDVGSYDWQELDFWTDWRSWTLECRRKKRSAWIADNAFHSTDELQLMMVDIDPCVVMSPSFYDDVQRAVLISYGCWMETGETSPIDPTTGGHWRCILPLAGCSIQMILFRTFPPPRESAGTSIGLITFYTTDARKSSSPLLCSMRGADNDWCHGGFYIKHNKITFIKTCTIYIKRTTWWP